MPTPEEMRALSVEGKEARDKRIRAKQRKQRAERQKKLDEIASYKDGIIRHVEWAMKEEAKKYGGFSIRTKVLVIERWSERDLYEPMLDEAVKHFTDQGYSVSYQFENQTEYYGDGAGPGEDWVYVRISWNADA